jgi:DNA-binding NarL/FixJ family response regulator
MSATDPNVRGQSPDRSANAEAELVYGWIVRHGPMPLPAPARLSGLDLTAEQIRAAVDALGAMRLLEPTAEGDQVRAASPRAATAALIGDREVRLLEQEAELLRQRRELAELQREITAFGPAYHQSRGSQADTEVMRTLEDEHAVRAQVAMATSECHSEVMTCQPAAGHDAVLSDTLPRDLALLGRGVRVRTLYQHTARFDRATLAYAAAMVKAGSEVRAAQELPPLMVIVDQTTAFLPRGSGGGGALMVSEPSVVRAFCSVFELVWRTAKPFRRTAPPAGDAIDETDSAILRMLAEGLTDRAIGVRLGLSERTCRDHVRKLYEKIGARSRFQAGVIAAEKGLLDQPPWTG